MTQVTVAESHKVELTFGFREVTCLRRVQFLVSVVRLPLGEIIYREMPVQRARRRL